MYRYTYYPINTAKGFDGKLHKEEVLHGGTVTATNEYIYNAKGELTQKDENNSIVNQTRYTYYSDGKLKDYIYYNDITIRYSYNVWGGLNEAAVASAPVSTMVHKLWNIWSRDNYGQFQSAYVFNQSNSVQYAFLKNYDIHGYPTKSIVRKIIPTLQDIVHNEYTYNEQTGNMMTRTDVVKSLSEEFTYDTEHDRLTKVHYPGIPLPDLEMEYSAEGNILKKSDVTTSVHNWRYNDYALETVPEPANTVAPFIPFEIPQNTLHTEYYPFRKIKKVWEFLKNEVVFEYGPDDERVKAEYYNTTATPSVLVQTKHYGENYERIIDHNTRVKTELYYIWADEQLIAVLRTETPPGPSPTVNGAVFYPFRDQLGSITHFIDDLGTGGTLANGIVEERSYDAWGRIRDPFTYVPYNSGSFPTTWITDRGYTVHEHIRLGAWNNNIINMDGRLYDPLTGRMFSPDPFIPDATNSQDYNKYVYARNNPLKYNDPDGNWVQIVIGAAIGGVVNLGVQAIKGNVNTFGDGLKYFGIGALGGALASVTGGAAVGIMASMGVGGFVGGAVSGAASGFVGGFVSGAGNSWAGGASFDDGLNNGFKAGGYGAMGGAIIGGALGGISAVGEGKTFMTGAQKYEISKADYYYQTGDGKEKLKPLTKGETKAMKNSRQWDHSEKGMNGKSGSKWDLYKDKKGNVFQVPKGNPAGGEKIPLHLNIKTLLKSIRFTIFDIPVGNFDLMRWLFESSRIDGGYGPAPMS
jgi:RHS repeat-associated protein